MNEEVFQRYSAYYDLLYRDKDYAAEAQYVGRVLRSAVPAGGRVLELGSGTGRHGRLLADQGFQVFGVERSQFMVDQAKRARSGQKDSTGFDCIVGDIRTVRLARRYDAAISLFHVISYQTANVDVLQSFATAAHHLETGGLFLFDVWHGPAVLNERPAVRVKRVEDQRVRLVRIAEPELDSAASVVTVRYTIFAESKTNHRFETFGEEHRMRYYFPVEIDLLAGQTGFKVEQSEEFLSGKPAGDRTWGVAYLLRKIQ
jgi:SAM-dependent methyltransferase